MSSPADQTGGAKPAPSAPSAPTGRLDRWIGAVAWAAAAVGAGVVLLMMSVVGYSVINRYLLGTPITWTDELSGYLVVALVMLGAAESLRRGDHISVDLITNRLGPQGQRVAAMWGDITVLVVAAVLLISGVETIEYSVNFGIISEGYLEVPMWIPQSFLILGAGLLALVAAASLLRRIKRDVAIRRDGAIKRDGAP